MKYNELFEKIRKSSKISEKESLLREGIDENLKKILSLTFNPYINFYIKKYKKETACGAIDISTDTGILYVSEALNKIAQRVVTGKAGITYIGFVRSELTADSQDIFDKILARDLKIGINESTINKVSPGLIPTFDVALANTFDPDKHTKLLEASRHYIARKIDGCRLVSIKKNGKWSFWSRQGKEFDTLSVLEDDLNRNITEDNIVLDGELCSVDSNGDENFSDIMKLIRKKDSQIKNPMYLTFDCLSLEDFENGSSITKFSKRYESLKNIVSGCTRAKALEQVEYSEEKFAELTKKSIDNNWEGLILRRDCEYKSGRSNDLLKCKQFLDFETTVMDTENGMLTFANAGSGHETIECMSAIKIEYKGNIVSVGSGFTKEERLHYFNSPQDIVGKIVTVKYFEESNDSKTGKLSLRFPTVTCVWGNKREY